MSGLDKLVQVQACTLFRKRLCIPAIAVIILLPKDDS